MYRDWALSSRVLVKILIVTLTVGWSLENTHAPHAFINLLSGYGKESEANLDIEMTNSWPKNLGKEGNKHWECLSGIVCEIYLSYPHSCHIHTLLHYTYPQYHHTNGTQH